MRNLDEQRGVLAGGNSVIRTKPLVSICICTFRRPAQLEQLLNQLDQQVTHDLFNVSIIVVDNDMNASGRAVAESCAKHSTVPLAYTVEPRQNIAIARNASVHMATGEFVAFIDDDEEPARDWLYRLYEVLLEYRADGVLGPVLPKFEPGTPNWAIKGQIFYRPGFETGTIIHWSITGTGNALVKREVLQELEGPFRAQFGAGGEDTDLFRRAMQRGRVFVWSAGAICHEHVPPERTRVGFQLRRALLRGKVAAQGHRDGWRGILKSAVAVPLYAIALPVCLLMGSHVFITLLVRSFDHLGKLLARCGIDLSGEKYIS